ncbi:MAG TPA: S41 family peptidase [Candidatus Absconditabacterales bacterium]|nr:S41 family peptidase [Candidatus Absconditabacterales bacterium]
MKKSKLIILFILGSLFGGFVWQIGHELKTLQQPVIQEGQINLDGLVTSIKNIVNVEQLGLGDKTYERFDTVYNVLLNSYYNTDKLNTGKMLSNALKAYVDAIDDPYTIYMDSEQNSGFLEEIKGSSDFEGIGAVISKKDYYIQIEEVIKGSPAFTAGLKMLDRIVMINTGSTKNLDVNEAVAQIRGPKGTKVKLFIERIAKDGTKEIIEKEITRDKLIIPSVNGKIITGTNNLNIGYINISIIGEETENLLKKTLSEFKTQKIEGIILDLRGNGGGLLPISVQIASHFIPKGKLVVSTKYTTFEDEELFSEGYGDYQNVPMVVLVDGLTASAGEIIALALQEQIGAQLVGTQTFGKGSIQTMDEFDDGASLKYTVGKRYTPNGENIDITGANPDVLIEFDTDKYINDAIDTQLEKAKEVLSAMIQ